mmetsp:Transcript_5576/g.15588  ORF Transcript_5576/g.15588 Transcript_5576/m.15588 type:complete len:387 (-) Transcript_5576:395-1555(-)
MVVAAAAEQLLHSASDNLPGLCPALGNAPVVIVHHVLLGGAGDAVVVLQEGHRLLQAISRSRTLPVGRLPAHSCLKLPRHLQIGGGAADIALAGSLGGEVAGPVAMVAVRVGEEVILHLLGPLKAVGVLCCHVVFRGRVEGVIALPVLGMAVEVVDETVQVAEPVVGVHVLEVRAHGEHDVRAPVHPRDDVHLSHKIRQTLLHVVVCQSRVVLHGAVGGAVVPVKAGRGAVVAAVKGPSEAVSRRGWVGLAGAPQHLQGAGVFALLEVLVIDPPKEDSIHARPAGHHGGVCLGVPKGVYLPANPRRGDGKLPPQPPVAPRGLVNHGHIMSGGLVMLHIPAIDKGQPPVRHEATNSIPCGIVLLVPPAGKEGNLAVHKPPVGVLLEG